jgi:hypothetical protein
MMVGQPIQWPWQRIARERRPFIWLALLLISLSGLVSGIALHALPHGATTTLGRSTPGSTTSVTPGGAIGTGTVVPVVGTVTPQYFSITMSPPATASPGGAFTITAHATLKKNGQPAPGVQCQLTFDAASQIPMPPTHTTDGSGDATWVVTIPPTATPGRYLLTLQANWGGFGVVWKIYVTVG